MAIRAQKHFEDYDAERYESNGRSKVRYVYKGDLYVREVDDRIRQIERKAYPPAALLAGGLLIAAMCQPVTANIDGIFAACSILAMIPAFCVLEGAIEAFFRKGDLKKENYQERLLMLRVAPAIGAAFNLILAIGYGWYAIQGEDRAANLAALLCIVAAAATDIVIAAHEIKTPYRIVKGPRSTGESPARTLESILAENDEAGELAETEIED